MTECGLYQRLGSTGARHLPRVGNAVMHHVEVELQRAVPILTVTDVAAAVREYTSLLGLEVVMDHGWIATLGSATGAQISVMARDLTAPCNPDVSIHVADVDKAFQQVNEGGAEIVHPLQDEPWGVRRFFFRSTDGQVINVLSHRGP